MKVVAVGSLKDRVQLPSVAERCWEAGSGACEGAKRKKKEKEKRKIEKGENPRLLKRTLRGAGQEWPRGPREEGTDCALSRPGEEEG